MTGDHNILGVDYAADSDIALARAVPFYLYVPPGYRGQSTYDPSRPGSHKDILPTLYHLSLPDTPISAAAATCWPRGPIRNGASASTTRDW